MSPEPRRSIVSTVAFPLFLGLLFLLLYLFRDHILGIFKTPETVRAWVADQGVLAPLAFVGLQIFQVIVFIVPGEIVQVAGGFLFGFWGGAFWSSLGILIGSLVNFVVGRTMGRAFVENLFGIERVRKLEAATEKGSAAAGFFLFFVIPGIPKDALCYVAGMGRLSFLSFILISGLGRLPGILGSTFMGSAAFKQDYRAALFVLAVASVLFFIGLFFKDKIADLVGKAIGGKRE